jgi:hypothetical protein
MHPHHPCLIREIIIREYACPPTGPRHIVLGIPEITRKGQPVANFPVRSDEIVSLPLLLQSNGAVVPTPPGDTFTAVSSDPSALNAVIGTMSNGLPALVINRLTLAMNDVTVTVSDSAGSTPATQVFTSADAPPVAADISIDTTNVERSTQPVPTV